MKRERIEAVAFDCYGTLVDFDDAGFARAYGQICAERGLAVDGKTFLDKWLEVWRRPGAEAAADEQANRPRPLSEPAPPVTGRRRSRLTLDGPASAYQPYREEWPGHFATCFAELGLAGDAARASERLRDLLREAPAYRESRRVVETLARRLPVAAMSNADNDFLLPCLARNGLVFPLVLSSEDVGVYKPHVSIFEALTRALGLDAANVLYVGDSRVADVVGAKHAGLQAAWLNRTGLEYHAGAEGGHRPFEPDIEITSLEPLLELVTPRPAGRGEWAGGGTDR